MLFCWWTEDAVTWFFGLPLIYEHRSLKNESVFVCTLWLGFCFWICASTGKYLWMKYNKMRASLSLVVGHLDALCWFMCWCLRPIPPMVVFSLEGYCFTKKLQKREKYSQSAVFISTRSEGFQVLSEWLGAFWMTLLWILCLPQCQYQKQNWIHKRIDWYHSDSCPYQHFYRVNTHKWWQKKQNIIW